MVTAFLIRLYYISKIALRGDEIAYLYDSYLITKGEVPLVDYHARTPIYLYYVSSFLTLFGNSVEAARLSSVVASTLTIYFIYKVTVRLFNKKAALVSCAIFAYSPFTIKYGSMLIPEVLLSLLFIITIFLIVKSLSMNNLNLLISAGILMGLAIFVRRTAGLSIIIIPLIILAYNHREKKTMKWSDIDVLRKSFTQSTLYIISFIIGFIPFFFLLAHLASWEYITALFSGSSAGKDVSVHQFPDYFIITYIPWLSYRTFVLILLFVVYLINLMQSIGKKILYLALSFPFILFFWYSFISPYQLNNNMNIIILILFFLAATPSSIMRKTIADNDSRTLALLVAAFMVIYLLLLHQEYYSRLGSQIFSVFLILILMSIVMNPMMRFVNTMIGHVKSFSQQRFHVPIPRMKTGWSKQYYYYITGVIFSIYFILSIEKSIYNTQEKVLLNLCYFTTMALIVYLLKYHETSPLQFGDSIILIWFSIIFLFYMNYGQFLDFYYYEFMIPLSLGGGVGFVRFIKQIPKEMNDAVFVLVSIIVASVLVSNSFIQNIEQQEKNTKLPSPGNIRDAAEYVNSVTEPDDRIFTMSLAVAVTSDRRVVMDISHAYFYHSPDLYISIDLLRYPTLDELEDYLIENSVKYAVIDWATTLDYFDNNPDFKVFFYQHYSLEKSIGIIGIYQLNEEYIKE